MENSVFKSEIFSCNGQEIHVKIAGADNAPILLMLHGFPEYWIAWSKVTEHLLENYRIILPDQRGFHGSSKPSGAEAYQTKHMVADMVDLIRQVSPEQKIILCGHDWGASVAYALTMRHSDLISHLIIANGVHPMCFQKALYAGGSQTTASQYMNVLSAIGSEERLSRENFKPLLNMFRKFSEAPWLNLEIEQQYRESWSRPDALTNMLNWYRSSPLKVPADDAPPQPFEITNEMQEKYKIPVPHLLIWGEQDTALLHEAWEDLHLFCDDLTIEKISDASHWILHEKPKKVASLIQSYLATS